MISSKAAALIDLWVGGLTSFLRAVAPSHMAATKGTRPFNLDKNNNRKKIEKKMSREKD